jgi:glycosyltransferase involved in cell wall biosynthesis
VALSSLNEGTPVSLIEAQAAAKPIVTTAVGGIRDIVFENESAFVVDTEDELGFSKNLRRLVEDTELRNRMGGSAESYVFKQFSYQRLVEDMKSLYERLLNR